MTASSLDRRGFLSVGGGAAAATLFGAGKASTADAKTRVVLVRRREVLGADGRVNGAVLHGMLNEAVAALLGEKDAGAAWRRLVKPADVVGVKSNVWGPLPTPPSWSRRSARRSCVLEYARRTSRWTTAACARTPSSGA